MRFVLTKEPYAMGWRLDLMEPPNADGIVAIADPVQMRCLPKGDVGGRERPAMLLLDNYGGGFGTSALQSLMDEMWREGIRPSDIGTAGHLAATQEHLKDMRAIVAKQLDVKL